MHQLTTVSIPRGKIMVAEALCGPVGHEQIRKALTSTPRMSKARPSLSKQSRTTNALMFKSDHKRR